MNDFITNQILNRPIFTYIHKCRPGMYVNKICKTIKDYKMKIILYTYM